MSIQKTIFMCFTILGLLIFLSSYFLTSTTSTTLINIEGFHNSSFEQIQTIKSDLLEAVEESFAYLVSGRTEERDEFFQWENNFQIQAENYSKVSKLNTSIEEIGKGLFDFIIIQQAFMVRSARKLFTAYEGKNSVNIKDFDEYESVIDSISKLLSKQVTIEKMKVAETQNQAFQKIKHDRNKILGIGSGSLILCLVFGWIISKYVKMLNESLIENKERLELALEGNNDGIWDWNVQTGEVFFSSRWMTMLGFQLNELPGNVSTWEKLVHPDDKPWVMEVLNEHLEGKTSFYTTEHRVMTKSGEYKWILDRGKVFSKTPDGKPLRATGTHTDITERKQIEEELEIYKNSLEALVEERTREMAETIKDLQESKSKTLIIQEDLKVREGDLAQAQKIAHLGSWTWDVQNKALSWSDEIYRIFEIDKNELKPNYEKFLSMVHEEDREFVHQANRESVLGKQSYDIKHRILMPNGDSKYVQQKSKTDYDRQGYPQRIVGILHDINKLKIAEDNLLKNRAKFRLLYSQISELLEGTSSATSGEKFFHSLVYHLGTALGFDFCFVASLDKKNPEVFNTLAFFMDGEIIENTQFKLHNTPCGVLYQGAVVYYLDNLQKDFPEDTDIEKFGLKSYLGVPIFGKEGCPIAHLVVMDRKPKDYSPEVMSILSLFSQRAAAEMIRIEIKKDLQNSQERLRKLNKKIQTVREEEKLHLSREIHDELGQVITYCKLDLLWIKKEIKNPGKIIAEKLGNMVSHLDDSLERVRKISRELRPEILDVMGISEAIKWQIEKFKDQTQIDYELDIVPDKIECEHDLSIDLFRIFQETLTNISRHAQATFVKINFTKENNFYKLTVKDNGKGFDTTLEPHFQSLGLLGMTERALNWDGEVNVFSKSGTGTTVTAILPIKDEYGYSASK
jgi:PAS domain S-box-containing protein